MLFANAPRSEPSVLVAIQLLKTAPMTCTRTKLAVHCHYDFGGRLIQNPMFRWRIPAYRVSRTPWGLCESRKRVERVERDGPSLFLCASV
eukprot:3662726-Rhodomonas_salina.4